MFFIACPSLTKVAFSLGVRQVTFEVVIEQNIHVCAGEAPLMTDADDTELEEELLLLEAELDNDSVTEIHDLPEAPRREKLPSTSPSKLGRAIEDSNEEEEVQEDEGSADSLEKAFAKLELELA